MKRDVGNVHDGLDDLRAAIQILRVEMEVLNTIYDDMATKTLKAARRANVNEYLSTEFLNARRDVLLISNQVDCDVELIANAVRRVLEERDWDPAFFAAWTRRLLPTLIEEILTRPWLMVCWPSRLA